MVESEYSRRKAQLLGCKPESLVELEQPVVFMGKKRDLLSEFTDKIIGYGTKNVAMYGEWMQDVVGWYVLASAGREFLDCFRLAGLPRTTVASRHLQVEDWQAFRKRIAEEYPQNGSLLSFMADFCGASDTSVFLLRYVEARMGEPSVSKKGGLKSGSVIDDLLTEGDKKSPSSSGLSSSVPSSSGPASNYSGKNTAGGNESIVSIILLREKYATALGEFVADKSRLHWHWASGIIYPASSSSSWADLVCTVRKEIIAYDKKTVYRSYTLLDDFAQKQFAFPSELTRLWPTLSPRDIRGVKLFTNAVLNHVGDPDKILEKFVAKWYVDNDVSGSGI